MAGGARNGAPRRRLPRASRISGSNEIRALMHRGKRSRTEHLDVFASASPVPFPRVALVVPRHRHSAVRRNRLKRQLREVVRLELIPRMDSEARPLDVLVRARREAYGAAFSVLRDELIEWLQRVCGHEQSSP